MVIGVPVFNAYTNTPVPLFFKHAASFYVEMAKNNKYKIR